MPGWSRLLTSRAAPRYLRHAFGVLQGRMESRESKERVKSDRVASSQFLMIAIVFVIALVVLLAWHPWVVRQVNGVQQTDVATSRP